MVGILRAFYDEYWPSDEGPVCSPLQRAGLAADPVCSKTVVKVSHPVHIIYLPSVSLPYTDNLLFYYFYLDVLLLFHRELFDKWLSWDSAYYLYKTWYHCPYCARVGSGGHFLLKLWQCVIRERTLQWWSERHFCSLAMACLTAILCPSSTLWLPRVLVTK